MAQVTEDQQQKIYDALKAYGHACDQAKIATQGQGTILPGQMPDGMQRAQADIVNAWLSLEEAVGYEVGEEDERQREIPNMDDSMLDEADLEAIAREKRRNK